MHLHEAFARRIYAAGVMEYSKNRMEIERRARAMFPEHVARLMRILGPLADWEPTLEPLMGDAIERAPGAVFWVKRRGPVEAIGSEQAVRLGKDLSPPDSCQLCAVVDGLLGEDLPWLDAAFQKVDAVVNPILEAKADAFKSVLGPNFYDKNIVFRVVAPFRHACVLTVTGLEMASSRFNTYLGFLYGGNYLFSSREYVGKLYVLARMPRN